MSLARWLQDRLGSPSPGRGCRHVHCIVCRADVIAGLDEDKCALAAVADPTPLSSVGEALALIEKRKTYELKRHNAGLALWVRSWWDISARPAGDSVIVLTEHRCGSAKLPHVDITPAPPKQGLPYDNEPPF